MEKEITIKDRCRQIEEIASTRFGEQYADASGHIVDTEALVIDVLANLRHFCDSRGLDFGKLDRVAYGHYLTEKAEERAKCKRRPQ